MAFVLVFGTSGCDKQCFFRSIANDEKGRFVRKVATAAWRYPFKCTLVRDELQEQISDIQKEAQNRPGTYFIGLHATHLAEAFIYSAVPLVSLRSLKPVFCITIFDDLYAMQARLRAAGYPYSYRDLILWLRAELAEKTLRLQKFHSEKLNRELFKSAVTQLHETFEKCDLAKKKQRLRDLIESIVIKDKSFKINFRLSTATD